jgi:hypothetical protein
MPTRPQFDDSEHVPPKVNSRPDNLPLPDGPFSKEELDALCEFLLLLDEWDRKRKIA